MMTLTTFFSEFWHVFFGGPWWATIFLAALFAFAVLEWRGVLRFPLAVRLPGSTAAVMLGIGAIFEIGLGITVYRTIWGQPDYPVLWFMTIVVGIALMLIIITIWLFWAARPPRFTIPPWVREIRDNEKGKRK